MSMNIIRSPYPSAGGEGGGSPAGFAYLRARAQQWFDPTEISGCRGYWAGRHLTGADYGRQLAAWVNKGAAGGTLVNATGQPSRYPIFSEGLVNGLNAASFYPFAINQGPSFTSTTTLTNFITNSAYTIFAVVRPLDGGGAGSSGQDYNNPQIFGDAGGFMGLALRSDNFRLWHDTPDHQVSVPYRRHEWQVVEGFLSGGVLSLAVNGNTPVTASSVGNVGNVTNTTYVGRGFNVVTTPYLAADLYALVIYNVALSATERARVRAGLALEAGVQLVG